MIPPASNSNTAVVTVLCYHYDQVPITYGFMFQSAEKQKITLRVFGRNEPFHSRVSAKVIRLRSWIDSLPPEIQHVLYVDARDTLFCRSLQAICDEFNAIGSPLVMAATSKAEPGRHIDWEARFPVQSSGLNFNNSGCFIGHRQTLIASLSLLAFLSEQVAKGQISISRVEYAENDQYLWQLAYVMGLIPLVLDSDQRIFDVAAHTPYQSYNFNESTQDAPVALKNGSRPSVLHFAGESSVAMPYAAWALNLVPLPNQGGE